MKVTIEIEDSDVYELLYDRITSFGEEPTTEEFDKMFEQHKETLKSILEVAVTDTIDYLAGGDEFEEYILEKKLVDLN